MNSNKNMISKIERSYRKAVIIPLIILLIVLILDNLISSISNHNTDKSVRLELLEHLVSSNYSSFAEEIFLERNDAIKNRMSSLISQYKSYIPNSDVCLTLLLDLQYPNKYLTSTCSNNISPDSFLEKTLYIEVNNEVFGAIKYKFDESYQYILEESFNFILKISLIGIGIFYLINFIIRRIKMDLVGPLLFENNRLVEQSGAIKVVQLLAHDLKGPFDLMEKSLELLDSSENILEYKKYLYVVRKNVIKSKMKAVNILNDILNFDRDIKIDKKMVSIRKILNEVLENINISNFREIKLEKNLTSSEILCDEDKINRVFYNIVWNAVQAMKGKGIISISINNLENNSISIIIKNTNSFLDEKSKNLIFIPYFTLGKKGGSGLGLAIAKKIIDAHGGKIEVDSDGISWVSFNMTLLNS